VHQFAQLGGLTALPGVQTDQRQPGARKQRVFDGVTVLLLVVLVLGPVQLDAQYRLVLAALHDHAAHSQANRKSTREATPVINAASFHILFNVRESSLALLNAAPR